MLNTEESGNKPKTTTGKGGRPRKENSEELFSLMIGFRVTESEKEHLVSQAKAARTTLARFLYERLVTQKLHFTVKKSIDKETLQALNRIGSNINQIAARLNSVADPHLFTKEIAAIEEIKNSLERYYLIEREIK